MRKILLLTGVVLIGLVGVAQAHKPPHPAHPSHPTHPSHPANSNPKSCTVRSVGYNAGGTLVSASLTGGSGHGGYSGTIKVDVTSANHGTSTGQQAFTLTDARVFFGPGVSVASPAAGTRVELHGKVTQLPKGCATSGFSPTITINDVDLHVAKG